MDREKLFVSGVPGAGQRSLGGQHYSYYFPATRITGLFRREAVEPLIRPEILARDPALARVGVRQERVNPHLIFKPFAGIRLLKPAYNICHVPWEFAWLPAGGRQTLRHPFEEPARMLHPCQEVWTGSSHAADLFREHGNERVHYIPCPVPVADAPVTSGRKEQLFNTFGGSPSVTLGISFGIDNMERHRAMIRPLSDQPALRKSSDPTIYMTIFNPGDFRKNAEKILRGFAAFAQNNPDAILVVKLVINNKHPTLTNVQQNTLLPKFEETTSVHSDNVIFISDDASENDMANLYRAADFYICLSIGEGQNLPLCEAMGQGVIPISVAHTAMADYIDDSVAIKVPSDPMRLYSPSASMHTIDGYVHAYDNTERDYLNALSRSAALSPNRKTELHQAALDRATDMFSRNAVRKAITTQSGFDFTSLVSQQ